MSTWFSEFKEEPSKILGSRRVQHSDLSHLELLIRPTTHEIFGDIKLEQLYETCCLSVLQHNERHDIVSGICLCNYPNVPSVSPCDWLTWLKTIYGISAATERNTMFVHLLVWDERYSNEFLGELLAAVFDNTTYCQYVILVVPPRVTPVNSSVFEREMTKVLAKTAVRDIAVQFLYLINRHRLRPKLKIRRVVEQDNDDVIAIVDGESTHLKKLYGEYCISEMIRHPSSCRQLIIGEDIDGSAVGVMCLNTMVDVDLLNENFELTPYNGLKKPQGNALPAVRCNEISLTYPTLNGEINVFILEMFATRDEMRPHWSHDFLEAAFECFPHLEYCAILLPFSHPYHQFLQHFVRVPLRCNRDFPMTLYIIHRVILREEIRCRRAEVQDREVIEKLLFATSTLRREILADFDLAMNSLQLDLDCFVFESNDMMLGLAILWLLRIFRLVVFHRESVERQINFVTNHYHIEDYVSVQSISQNDYGRLLHFVLMPIFSAYYRFFFREIARLSELTVIFYRLYREDESSLPWMYPLIACLNDMIPVDPRRQAEYEFPIIRDNDLNNCSENNIKDERDDADERNDEFSLFMISPRLAMMPRTIIDTRIVVVGASNCGIAFTEYLTLRLTQRYTQLTNVTLISPHGIPFDNNESNRADYCGCLLPFRGRFHSRYRRCVAARTWINIVYGTMTAINRREKYVTVMNQGNFSYDYLVLTCGLQYQNSTLREKMKTQKQKQNKVQDQLQVPWNCLSINDDMEAFTCIKKIRWLTGNLKERKAIFLYGRNTDCYCALGGLIKLGIKPSWITLIEPSSLKSCETRDQALFHDYQVNEMVTNAILQSGVEIFSKWNMIDWTLQIKNDDAKLMIESVTIEREGETKKLTCDVLFNFYEKTIDLNAFLAFCQADLIFDGSLIIDSQYRTNDPFIFAAGTVTRYSRKFYANVGQHKHYNSMEIGERLAQILWKLIEWDVQVSERMSKKEIMYLTSSTFRAPVVIACILPGNYYYLHVRRPGKTTWDNTACKISLNHCDKVFVTGSRKSEIGYFRIQLNGIRSVESITCVSRKTFRVQDMIALYGKHESMLNELKFRFRNSCISDFYTYFCEPWAAAIFHNRFDCLRVENRAVLFSRVDDSTLIDDCVRILVKSKWKTISEKDRRYIESRYAGSTYHQKLENNLVNFLEFYENDLPMYCILRKQRQMYKDIAESPLYFDQ
ncbi:PREDICTED: LOW QUALITY PROTEIN: cilia- and flagella-associated protein 61-like [Wasmannia auropunctata]|uniref:LOW QUALITY PROTEIN: cilia- and flagella-associated protein 61-like n=1 Tax=Wasmannia auropunctata TaxID=64793 RepID=UPI0005EEA4E3|nr:PREDICTED: LOW QUALITY PROTEIN: cilia- and flagella-associated protein 61-like [Wasmannia auropunctata]